MPRAAPSLFHSHPLLSYACESLDMGTERFNPPLTRSDSRSQTLDLDGQTVCGSRRSKWCRCNLKETSDEDQRGES